MRSKEELTESLGQMFRKIRKDLGYSKAKMADLMYVDVHTYNKYEAGTSVPDVATFLWMFSQIGMDPLRKLLEFGYPEHYENLQNDERENVDNMRKAAAHYFLAIATDHAVRVWNYLLYGDHGSVHEAQLEEYDMIAHLPMQYRFVVANAVMTLYALAEQRNELIADGIAMPDVRVFQEAMAQGGAAAFQGKNSYSMLLKN